jgi:transcription termination factor Rho
VSEEEETEAAGNGQDAAPNYPEPDYEIDELRRLGQQELLQIAAREEGVKKEGAAEEEDAEAATLQGLSRRELVARILFARGRRGSLGREQGILQVRAEGFGFLRSVRHDYRSGPDDVYISPNQIHRLRLRDGDEVVGATRPPHRDEAYFALWRVDRVNGLSVRDLFQRVPFADLTPVLASRQLRLAYAGGDEVLPILELLAPMALGHRTLIRLPPMVSGRSLLTTLAEGILRNQPEVWVLVLQVGERPEEHIEVRRRLGDHDRCEVCACSFAEPTAMQTALAGFVLARARRLVETGRDVVLIVDSLTRLVRAHNMEVPHSGKIIGPDLDAMAFQQPKVLFGSARSVEEGGSLTVFATVKQDGGSQLDQIIAAEFHDRANAEIVLHEELCELHGHLGIDVLATRTRREDDPTDMTQQQQLHELRQTLAGQPPATALTTVRRQAKTVQTVKTVKTNA